MPFGVMPFPELNPNPPTMEVSAMDAKTLQFARTINFVSALLEEGLPIMAANLMQTSCKRHGFSRDHAMASLRSKLYHDHGVSHVKYMANFAAGCSMLHKATAK